MSLTSAHWADPPEPYPPDDWALMDPEGYKTALLLGAIQGLGENVSIWRAWMALSIDEQLAWDHFRRAAEELRVEMGL